MAQATTVRVSEETLARLHESKPYDSLSMDEWIGVLLDRHADAALDD